MQNNVTAKGVSAGPVESGKAALKPFVLDMSLPRGLRNNNPLNIRDNKYTYAGEIKDDTDKAFKTFLTLKDGLKAAYSLLRNSYILKGHSTVEKIIHRWSPEKDDNDPASYMSNVKKYAGFDKGYQFIVNSPTFKNDVAKLIVAMSKVENGANKVKFTEHEVLAAI